MLKLYFKASTGIKYSASISQFVGITGDEAVLLKKTIKTLPQYINNSNIDIMMYVLKEKFKDITMKQLLLNTGNSFLLEHDEMPDHDYFWSNNSDGT
jgi:predicted NAD-dependent protein-ADP-ribosyltransferase YbiA (DUF1768 family)